MCQSPQRIWQVYYAKIRAQTEKECGPVKLDRDIWVEALQKFKSSTPLNPLSIQQRPNLSWTCDFSNLLEMYSNVSPERQHKFLSGSTFGHEETRVKSQHNVDGYAEFSRKEGNYNPKDLQDIARLDWSNLREYTQDCILRIKGNRTRLDKRKSIKLGYIQIYLCVCVYILSLILVRTWKMVQIHGYNVHQQHAKNLWFILAEIIMLKTPGQIVEKVMKRINRAFKSGYTM